MSGKITDARFEKLSMDYEEKQSVVKEETELAQSEETINNVEYFLKIVRQYTDIQELNARVVNDLIDKIKIHAAIKENGQRIQQIDIYYTAVGIIDIPQHFQEFAI